MSDVDITITIEREPVEVESYSVEDTGGDFDTDEGLERLDAQDEAQVRRAYYERTGCTGEVRG